MSDVSAVDDTALPAGPQGGFGDGQVFDPALANGTQPKKKPQPAYRIYDGSKIAVGKAVGKLWKSKYDAAVRTYSEIWPTWQRVFEYYNANSESTIAGTPRGTFKKGDEMENVVYANVNVMLNATYTKNPTVTCTTKDATEEDFCDTLEALIHTLMHRVDQLNLKPKAKRAVGFALLTNLGIVKLDYVEKDDSQETVRKAMQDITTQMETVKTTEELDALNGQLMALESQMEVTMPSGFNTRVIPPHRLLLDPTGELPDGTDGMWMMEGTFLPTEYLKARFTQKDADGVDVLVYKPTHKVSVESSANARDDGLGMVLEAINAGGTLPTAADGDERLAYLYKYMTECVYVWDKATRRIYLFLKDDWAWPIWVWDDYLNLTRFFPYFITAFGMNTGRGTTVGEASYVLDHQDAINDINRQRARIRRTVFDYFFYNSNKLPKDEAEKLIAAIRGETAFTKHAVGVALDEGEKLDNAFMSLAPPSADYEKLFDKADSFEAINRISSTNDALRGGQFRTNTNVPAVQAYQEAAQLSIGGKVDPIEDMLSDLARGVAEIAVQKLTKADVVGFIGGKLAQAWPEGMDIQTFRATYNLEIVGGSTEKPNSVFKKKEAIQIAQAVGQFAKAAPGATLTIMLKLFENAFTDVNVKKDDWEMLKQEIAASMQKGVSTGGAAGADAGAPPAQAPTQGQPQPGGGNPAIDQLLAQVPPEVKQKAAQAAQSGATPEEVVAILKGGGAGGPAPQPAQQGVH